MLQPGCVVGVSWTIRGNLPAISLALAVKEMSEIKRKTLFAVVLLLRCVFSNTSAAQSPNPSLAPYIEPLAPAQT